MMTLLLFEFGFVDASTDAEILESQASEMFRIPQVAAVHDDRLAHKGMNFCEVDLLELVPFGGQHQGIGPFGHLIGIFA